MGNRKRDARSVSSLTAYTLLLMLGLACDASSGGDLTDGWQAEIDTIGDTIRVRTVAGSVWGDPATLVPEVSIGMMDGPDEYVFGDPSGLGVMDDGTILVLDYQVPVLRAFASDGTFLHNIGREGDGPGEYGSPDGIGILPDGRIIVRDPPNARITLFDVSGESLGQWYLAGGFNSGSPQQVDSEGNSYVRTILERGTAPWEWKFGMIRYNPDGEIVDTIPAPTWGYDAPKVTASRENSSSSRDVPFSATDSWAFSPLGYMVGGLSTDYRIDLFRTDEPVLRIEKEWTPVPVLTEEGEERRRRITESLSRQYGSWSWNGPSIPDTKPPFKDVLVSEEGDLWVVLSSRAVPVMTPAEAREEEARTGRPVLRFNEPLAFDVFRPDGRYLGPVNAPPEFRIDPVPVIRGDTVWAVDRDELDIPRVTRYRIEKGASPPAGRTM